MKKSYSCFLFFCCCCCFVVVVVVRGGIMFVCVFSFGFVKRRLLSVFLYGEVSIFVFDFSNFVLCKAGLVESYCVNVFLSWNILVSPSMVI